MSGNVMESLSRAVRGINRALVLLGGVALVAMMLLTSANIFLRTVWLPIRGTFELMGFLGAVAVSFSLGYTQLGRGHIAVDVLFHRFPGGVVRFLTGLNSVICGGFFSLLAWQVGKKGLILMRTGEVSETLRIPFYPVAFGVAAGCGFLTLVFVADLVRVLVGQQADSD
ncbi:MAG: TRAP transporter small permease [Desulfococcaceae bacterium]